MNAVLIVAAVLIALPGAVSAVHLTLLSVASLFYREPSSDEPPRLRFLVVVPARNEAPVIGHTVSSLGDAMRSDDILLVCADRCTDETARVARDAGARVLERVEGDTPGRAATIADGISHAADWEWDALCTIDADSVVNREFFTALEVAFAGGADVAQPRSEHVRESGILRRIAEAAFVMQGVTLPRGRTALGLGVRLRGSGMTMLRRIVESYPFTTQGVSEDMFYSLSLILNDINAVHVDTARLLSLAAPTLTSGGNQRVRWEVGRLAAARSHSLELLRHGSPTSVEMAILLITPPFAVAAFLLILAAVLSLLASQTLVMVICIAMIIALGVDLAIGLIQTKAPWQTWAALGAAPLYIPWKAALQIVAIARLKSADKAYEPTARE